MRRIAQTPRPGWQGRVEASGLTFHTDRSRSGDDDISYWNEAAAYQFTAGEAEIVRNATAELHRMCLEAARYVAERDEMLDRFAVPSSWRAVVRSSLRRGDPSLYGRFDLAFDGSGPPVMLEYNADTPTSLIETAEAQRDWLDDVHPGAGQSNRLRDMLVARLRTIRAAAATPLLHVSSVADGGEDEQTARYIQRLAIEAGWDARFIAIADVGWDDRARCFVDLGLCPLRAWFKLYPWEWAIEDAFGVHLRAEPMLVLEPAWKMLLSNKALLPVLWHLFPGHPNLLPASFDPGDITGSRVRKPIRAREGANITLEDNGRILAATGGSYGDEPYMYQKAAPLFRSGGCYAVLGSWIVGDEAAGIVVREDAGPIITNASRVVPHVVDETGGSDAAFLVS